MPSAHDTVDEAVRQVETLRKVLKKSSTAQVRAVEERNLAKATALAWFNNLLPVIRDSIGEEPCQDVSAAYHDLLAFTDRATVRSKYDETLKSLKKLLAALRPFTVGGLSPPDATHSSDRVPDFSPLIGDSKMQSILCGRWKECVICIASNELMRP